MYATNYLETLVLNTLRGQVAQAPSGLFLALYLNDPGETGTAGTEVVYSGYARQPVSFSAPAAMNGGIGVVNVADITFPVAPVPLGAVSHIGVLDSLTGGNMLLYGEFTESIQVEANEAPVVVAGEAQWWMTGNMSNAFRTRVLNLLHGALVTGFTAYLALYNGNPESGGSELSGDNYARVMIPFAAPSEQVGGQMQIVNSEQITSVRASAPWGTWTHTAVMDSETSGMPVYYAQRSAKEVRKGMLVTVMEGELALAIH